MWCDENRCNCSRPLSVNSCNWNAADTQTYELNESHCNSSERTHRSVGCFIFALRKLVRIRYPNGTLSHHYKWNSNTLYVRCTNVRCTNVRVRSLYVFFLFSTISLCPLRQLGQYIGSAIGYLASQKCICFLYIWYNWNSFAECFR